MFATITYRSQTLLKEQSNNVMPANVNERHLRKSTSRKSASSSFIKSLKGSQNYYFLIHNIVNTDGMKSVFWYYIDTFF